MEDKLLTLDEVVTYLKIPKSTIYKLSQKGKIPSAKIGKQLRFRKSSIETWVADKETSLRLSVAGLAPIAEERSKIKQRKSRILLIDDDPLVLRSMTKFLRSQGHDVEVAQNAQQAVKHAENSAFDLVISDIRMPDLSGIEAIKQIRKINSKQNRKPVPEIIITGYMDPAAEEEARGLGINDYLYKPFSIEDFIKTIDKKLNLPA